MRLLLYTPFDLGLSLIIGALVRRCNIVTCLPCPTVPIIFLHVDGNMHSRAILL